MKMRSKLAALLATAGLTLGLLASATGVAASTNFYWNGVNGLDATGCDATDPAPSSMLWIFTGGSGVSNVVFHSPSSSGDTAMTQPGGSKSAWKATVDYFDMTAHTGDNSVYVSYDGTLAKHAVLTLSHCDGSSTTETSSITSTVKDAQDVVLDDANPGIAPVTAHDTAQITFSGGGTLPEGSHVQFFFYQSHDCSGDSVASDQFDVSDQSSVVNVDGTPFAQGPLGAGEYSFQANFTSGDEGAIDSATGDCEPFVVLTSTEFPATDVPTEPNTATIGGTGSSGPSDSSWLLVVALGVLLASVVVMTPARAKNRR